MYEINFNLGTLSEYSMTMRSVVSTLRVSISEVFHPKTRYIARELLLNVRVRQEASVVSLVDNPKLDVALQNLALNSRRSRHVKHFYTLNSNRVLSYELLKNIQCKSEKIEGG